MEDNGLIVVDLDEIATRWQLPVERVIYFISEMGMDPAQPEEWVVDNWDIWISEKQEAFEALLFPRELRIEPAEASA